MKNLKYIWYWLMGRKEIRFQTNLRENKWTWPWLKSNPPVMRELALALTDMLPRKHIRVEFDVAISDDRVYIVFIMRKPHWSSTTVSKRWCESHPKQAARLIASRLTYRSILR